jgi:acyl carrier protein
MTKKMTFENFKKMLAEELALPVEELVPEASLVKDLQVDSIALASMILRLEEMGVSLPLESAWEIETVEDAYQTYIESLEAQNSLTQSEGYNPAESLQS